MIKYIEIILYILGFILLNILTEGKIYKDFKSGLLSVAVGLVFSMAGYL